MSIHDEVKSKIEEVSEIYYDLGKLFYEVFDTSAYEDIGYVGHGAFARYCSDELGYSPDSAQERMRIYKTFSELGITRDELKEISFSNALKLVPIINRENKDKWLELARTMTVKELKEYIKGMIGTLATANATDMGLSVDDRTFHKFTIKTDLARADFIQSALDFADKQYDCGGNLNEAFYRILQDYSTIFHNKAITMESALAIFNDRYNSSLTPQQVIASRKGVTVNA